MLLFQFKELPAHFKFDFALIPTTTINFALLPRFHDLVLYLTACFLTLVFPLFTALYLTLIVSTMSGFVFGSGGLKGEKGGGGG